MGVILTVPPPDSFSTFWLIEEYLNKNIYNETTMTGIYPGGFTNVRF